MTNGTSGSAALGGHPGGPGRRPRSGRRVAIVIAWCATTALSPPARACGASGGSVGASACSMGEHEESRRRKWRVGAAYELTSTRMRFAGQTTFDETRSFALASIAHQPTAAWTFELGIGPIFGGRLEAAGGRFELDPGVATALGASYRVLEDRAARPFVLATAQLAYAHATSRDAGIAAAPATGYDALDLRVGAVVGWSLAGVVRPYALARAFGGPAFWSYQGSAVLGTDTHHYQLGAGLLVSIARRVDLYAEGIPLGERAFGAGGGVAF